MDFTEKDLLGGNFICPLYKDEIQTDQRYDRHRARHLQELAFFVLPCTEDDSDAGGGDAGSRTEPGTESHASKDLPGNSNTLLQDLNEF